MQSQEGRHRGVWHGLDLKENRGGRGVWGPAGLKAALGGSQTQKQQLAYKDSPLLSGASREFWAPGDRFPLQEVCTPQMQGPLGGCAQGVSGAGSAPTPPATETPRWAGASFPTGLHCSWTSIARSPGSSEVTSSWCLWGTTSDMTSPRSGMPSSLTTSGSLTSSTASLTSMCRWEGALSLVERVPSTVLQLGLRGSLLPLPAPGQGSVPDSWVGSPFYVRIPSQAPQLL